MPSNHLVYTARRFYAALVPVVTSLLMISAASLDAKPVQLRCEYLTNPIGIDIPKPNLSWRSDSTERNWKQTAYQIVVASTADQLHSGQADIWDSGKQSSGESTSIQYKGPALLARRRYFWAVRVWDNSHRMSQSVAAWWEMGLLQPSDWTAQWIGWRNPEDQADRAGIKWIWAAGPDALHLAGGSTADFHLDLNLPATPQRAALFLIARGDWKVTVNGRDAGAKPHWNEFDRRDLNGLLVPGKNSIDITVTLAKSATPIPGALAALLKLQDRQGNIERFPTGEKWQARAQTNSPWTAAHVVASLDDPQLGNPGPLPQPASLLRKQFSIGKQIAQARVYATALGAYELLLNGKRVSRDLLTPGFTDYSKRVQYQTYDVKPLLANGANVMGAMLGEGWFGSGISWTAEHFALHGPPRFLAQLEIEYSDGSRATISTGPSWKASQSPILHSEIYAGETYDARLEQNGWDAAGFDDRTWIAATPAEPYSGVLSSQIDAPPRVVQVLRPESVKPSSNGSFIYDFGQNMVGWAALKVHGPIGTTVRMRFAEILEPGGDIYVTNLRNADATDRYTLRGQGDETFRPRFTFHGFRYVEVTGYPGRPTLDDLSGEVISSLSGEPTAKVTTSSSLVNRMWQIGIWGQRGNFLSIPTDCPQRDERLGWMADAAVFWRTGSYNFDTASFTHKWSRDIRDAQLANGAFSNVSPNIGVGSIEGAPGWGDAGVIVPWTTWLQYGDRSMIEQNWDSMQRWMVFIQESNPDFIRKQKVGPDFADWLAPDPTTPKPLVDTAYWALTANMMSDMARAIDKPDDARKYAGLYQQIRAAFRKEFIKPDGQIGSGTQTSYVVALHMNLVPAELEAAAVNHLVAAIDARGGHVSTGFLGTPFLLFALADHGKADVAYRLLLNDTYPSWGYMLSKGATTWWERWNGDSGDPAMNSYNHYAFGSVVAWIYQRVAGIDTTLAGAGFHQIVIQPLPDTRVTQAHGEYESAYGRIISDWQGTSQGPLTLAVTIPPNTTAKILLPAIPHASVRESGKPIKVSLAGDRQILEVGSGSYHLEVK